MKSEIMNKGKLPLSWEECEAYRKAVFKERWNSGIMFRCVFVLMSLWTILGFLIVVFFASSQGWSFFVTFLLLDLVFVGFYWYLIPTGLKEWKEKGLVSTPLGMICFFVLLILWALVATNGFQSLFLSVANLFLFVFLAVGPFGLVDRIRICRARRKYLSSLPLAPPISSDSSNTKDIYNPK